MIERNVKLDNPTRFGGDVKISEAKLKHAAEKALDVLSENISKFNGRFPQNASDAFVYHKGENNNWTCGMFTGTYWLAFEMTGDKKFKDEAIRQTKTYKERFEKGIGIKDHDVGFVYSPSCVAGYKITGDEEMREIALKAAEALYNYSYCKEGGFIMRMMEYPQWGGYRTMMDTLMNIALLFWAGEESGDSKFIEAAISQLKITEKYLIREDGSSYHHMAFDYVTKKPICGITLQGNGDESCWSRGHAWGVYGFPIAYNYIKEDWLIKLHKDVTYFMLNHLPDDLIPYWDYDFVSGDEPRDSSAGAISVCGMMEMCRHLPDSEPDKKIFENASAMMLEALIDTCTEKPHKYAEGLLYKTSGAVSMGLGIEAIASYGDYPYLDALMRFLNPNWKMHW